MFKDIIKINIFLLSSNTEIKSLVLLPSWNQMRGINKLGTVLLKGIVDSQKSDRAHYIYPEGAEQIFIYQPWNYKTLLEP